MIRKISFIIIAFSSLLMTGCASQRGWRYAAEPQANRMPLIDRTVSVPPFADARPDKNNNALLMYLVPIVPFGWCDYSIPESGNMKLNSAPVWQFRPTEDLAKAAAEELQVSGLFKEVFFTNRPSEAELVFSGKIKSTRYSGTLMSYGLSSYGPLLWLLGFPAGSVRNELELEFSLKDSKSNLTLWNNAYKRNYDKVPVWIYSLPNDFAYDILYKQIMLESIKDMERKLSSYKNIGVSPRSAVDLQSKETVNLEEKTEEIKRDKKENRSIDIDLRSKSDSYAEYYRSLYKTISSAVVKPMGSSGGIVNAAFTLSSDGSLEDVQILDGSSEDVELRDAVIKAIRDTSPFPSFPEEIKSEGKKTFTITIEFRSR